MSYQCLAYGLLAFVLGLAFVIEAARNDVASDGKLGHRTGLALMLVPVIMYLMGLGLAAGERLLK